MMCSTIREHLTDHTKVTSEKWEIYFFSLFPHFIYLLELVFDLAKPCLLLMQVDLSFTVRNPLDSAGGKPVKNKLMAILLMHSKHPLFQ
jgi:hypothetical protein